MPRARSGKIARNRRKKILKLAKGYFGSKHRLYRTANEQVMKALKNSYHDRKRRKRDFRKLWITRINAAAKQHGTKYSILIHGLSLAGVEVNRKVLADIAVFAPNDFKMYVDTALNAIANKGNTKVVEKTKELPKAKAETEVVTKEVVLEVVDYSKMLVKELRELAQNRGIETTGLLKADLVAQLEAQDKN